MSADNGWRDAISQLACEGGDDLANTLDDAKRRERILAEIATPQIPAFGVAYCAIHASQNALRAIGCQATPAARNWLVLSAAHALAAIEAIDKENGR
jgi:hypothetical protein